MLSVPWAAIQTTEDAPALWLPTHPLLALPPGPGSFKYCLCTAPEDRRVQPQELEGESPPATLHWGRITDLNPRSVKDEVRHAHELGQQHEEQSQSCADTGRPPTARPGPGVMAFLPAVIFYCFY